MKLNITLTSNSFTNMHKESKGNSSSSSGSDFAVSSPKKRAKHGAATLKMEFEGNKNLTGTEFLTAMSLNSPSKRVNQQCQRNVANIEDTSSESSNSSKRKKAPLGMNRKAPKSSNESSDTSDEEEENIRIKRKKLHKKKVKYHSSSSDSEEDIRKEKDKSDRDKSLSTDLDESLESSDDGLSQKKQEKAQEVMEEIDLEAFAAKHCLTEVKLGVISDLFKENKEVFVVRVPNYLEPQDLKKLELSLTENKNIQFNGQDFYTECKTEERSFSLLSKVDDKFSLHPVTSHGTITVKRAYARDDIVCFRVKKSKVKNFQKNLAEACSILDTTTKPLDIKNEDGCINEESLLDPEESNENQFINGIIKKKKKHRHDDVAEENSEDLFATEYVRSSSGHKKKKKKNKERSLDLEQVNVLEMGKEDKTEVQEIDSVEDSDLSFISPNKKKKSKKNKHKKLEGDCFTEDCIEINTEDDLPKKKLEKAKKHRTEEQEEVEENAIANSTFINPNEKLPEFEGEGEVSLVPNDIAYKKPKKHKRDIESYDEDTGVKSKKKKKKFEDV